MPHDRPARHGEPWLAFAGVLALVLFVFRDVLHAWFGADDFLWLEIGTARSVLGSFVGPWGHGAAFRPLSRVSFYVDDLLFGLEAGPWHLDTLVWHAAGATAFGVLLDRVSGERALAIVATLIFVLFPLHYETTMWISGRSHLLAFTGCMACLLVLTRILDRPSPRLLLLCAGLLAAALLSYEAAVYTLPLAVLVVLARGRPVAVRPALLGLGTIALVTAIYLLLRRWALAGATLYPMEPLGSYLTMAFAVRVGGIVAMLLAQLAPSPWWFGAAIVVAAWTAPRLLGIAAFGVAVMAVGYLPFIVIADVGFRFLYCTQAGLAIVLAAALIGLSRVQWLGKPAAALLLVLLLTHEIGETEQIAAEWRAAGELGRLTLDRLVAAWHDPDPDRPAVILGAPASLGHAFVFFTYFDLALGAFHPEYAGLRMPGFILTAFSPQMSRALVGGHWQREQERRKRHGLPPLACTSGNPDRAPDLDGFLKKLLDCGAVFYSIDQRTLTVRRLSRPFVEERIERGWRTPLN